MRALARGVTSHSRPERNSAKRPQLTSMADCRSRGRDSERFARLVSVRRARLHSSRLGLCPICDLEICAVAAGARSLDRLALVMSVAFMRANANVARMHRDQLSIGTPQNEARGWSSERLSEQEQFLCRCGAHAMPGRTTSAQFVQ